MTADLSKLRAYASQKRSSAVNDPEVVKNLEVMPVDRAAYLEAIVANLPECVGIIGPNMGFLELNPAGLSKFGVSKLEDLPKGAPLSQIAEQDRELYRQKIIAVLDGDKSASEKPVIVTLHAASGIIHKMECHMSPLHSDDGVVQAVLVTSRDISQWQEALETAEESQSVLETILATVPDPMVMIDQRGHITSFSTAAETLFGYEEQELQGQNIKALMPEPYHSEHDVYIDHYLRTGEKRIIGIGRKVKGRKKDGTIFPMRLSVGEAVVGNHRIFTGFIIDLTEQENAQAELQKVQAELMHSSRLSAVGSLASALAHEINQPLAAIANYMSAARDMLGEDFADTKELLHEALQESVSESLRAGTIVRRLREFVTKGEVNREILSIAQLVEDATTLGLVGAYDKGVDSSINIDLDTNHVFADRVQMQQVMVNLMRNAIEAMADSPVKHLNITVRSVPNDRVEIAVTDTGSGIDPEMTGRVFNPFASTKSTGMGLGLSICRTIIEAHEGKITVEPNPDGGTIFRITLPKATQENDDAE